MFKKSLIICLLLGFCLTTIVSPISAEQLDINSIEKSKQETIDELFNNLNEVVNEQKFLNHLVSSKSDNSSDDLNSILNFRANSLKAREALIDDQILNLGVKKLDPNSSSDMELLSDLMKSQIQQERLDVNISSIPDPPDLAALASLYTLYHYQGTYTYQGVTYDYAYIRVVDNKGYNKLYLLNQFLAAPANTSQNVILSILAHTFKYSFSALLNSTPAGMITDWTMGAVLTILNNKNTNLLYSTSDPFYSITINSTTSMTYYWIYHNNDWRFNGSGGSFNLVRKDATAFNYQGQAYQDSVIQPSWNSNSSQLWYDYVENFHHYGHLPNYVQINNIGSIIINGDGQNFTYSPKFAPRPIDLL